MPQSEVLEEVLPEVQGETTSWYIVQPSWQAEGHGISC
jgi:hypothetical protein